MPAFKPISDEDGFIRGRNRITKCLFQLPSPTERHASLVAGIDKEFQVFKKEWFAGNLEIDVDDEGDNRAACSCGQTIKFDNSISEALPISMKINSFPPYLCISDGEATLVKGATGRRIMQFHEGDVLTSKIAPRLAKQRPTEKYSSFEVLSIIRTYSSYGLTGETPLATESWEREPIEGWWLKEDSFCETSRREEPVGEDVTGYDSDLGWWRNKQSAKRRDWSRWGLRSVGPECWRRDQRRLYSLYGSAALRTDGGD